MQANIARMRRFRFRFRHFEMFLCQLGELQSKESPGCLMNLEEKDDQRVGVCPLRHLLKEQGSASAQGDVVLTAVATTPVLSRRRGPAVMGRAVRAFVMCLSQNGPSLPIGTLAVIFILGSSMQGP